MYHYSDTGTCPYGDYWRKMRNICILELLSTKMVKSFDSIGQAEMLSLISSINSMPDSLINLSDKIFWFAGLFLGRDKLMMLIKEITLLTG
uniref:Cytochrome P450 n=1 Tax=Solanum lycopersicum TaxID=4081 RepID=A0A3Q7FSJ3_SOLLC